MFLAILEWIFIVTLIVGSIYVGVGSVMSFYGTDKLSPSSVTSDAGRMALQITYILMGIAGLSMAFYVGGRQFQKYR
jgi:uncharacterized membrane protein YuzA (DUF378 family)